MTEDIQIPVTEIVQEIASPDEGIELTLVELPTPESTDAEIHDTALD